MAQSNAGAYLAWGVVFIGVGLAINSLSESQPSDSQPSVTQPVPQVVPRTAYSTPQPEPTPFKVRPNLTGEEWVEEQRRLAEDIERRKPPMSSPPETCEERPHLIQVMEGGYNQSEAWDITGDGEWMNTGVQAWLDDKVLVHPRSGDYLWIQVSLNRGETFLTARGFRRRVLEGEAGDIWLQLPPGGKFILEVRRASAPPQQPSEGRPKLVF
jgi:hypothetical protein